MIAPEKRGILCGMEAIVREIDAGRLAPVFDIPESMRNGRVEVTVRPVIEEKTDWTVAEKIELFRKKHNRGTFAGHLESGVSQGLAFGFDARKVIDGTETEEERQARYRMEKQTWGELARGEEA